MNQVFYYSGTSAGAPHGLNATMQHGLYSSMFTVGTTLALKSWPGDAMNRVNGWTPRVPNNPGPPYVSLLWGGPAGADVNASVLYSL